MKYVSAICSLFLFASCVGTIEEAPSKQVTTPAASEKLNFSGIASCKAISDDKIEVLFKPAEVEFGSVSQDDLVYQAFLDGAFDSASASGRGADLVLDKAGYHHMIVKNLELATNYKVTVRVVDPISGQTDPNILICEAKTDSEYKPKFDGLTAADPYPGVDGETTAYLTWNPARAGRDIIPGIADPNYNIKQYDIYFGEDPDDLVLITSLGPDEKDYSFVPQTNPPGPTMGKTFYFKVNAIDVNDRQERNTIVRSLTFEPLEKIEFAGIQTATVINKVEGFYSMDISWEMAKGRFNLYKVYAVPNVQAAETAYAKDSIGDLNSPTYYKATIKDLLRTEMTVNGLDQKTQYKFYVVACYSDDDNSCSAAVEAKGNDVNIVAATSPKVAPFGGITNFVQPSGSDGLTSFELKWNAPSSEGICTQINVRNVYDDLQDLPVCEGAGDDGTEICLEVQPNCASTEIKVMRATTDEKYCLEAYVTAYGEQQLEGTIVTKCGQLAFESPVFQGDFLQCNVKSASEIELTWTEPNPLGVFNNYILFAKEVPKINPLEGQEWLTNAKLEFDALTADANICITDASKYCARSYDTTSFTDNFINLKPNTTYAFMIKTLAQITTDTGVEKKYDANTVLQKCTTGETQLEFVDWKHIAALGPNFNESTGAIVPESITGANLSGGSIGSFNYSTGGADDGEEGNVYLAFRDFQESDGTTFEQKLIDLGVQPDSTIDGYIIFRSVEDFPQDPSTVINNIDHKDSTSWVPLNKDNPVRVNADGFVEYIDTISGDIHPIKDLALMGLTESERGQRGRVVSYAIRAIINDEVVRLDPIKSANAIIKVIIPPKNMAMLHPWIVNKKYCENIAAATDPENNYRCESTGPATIEDATDEKLYFEEKAFTLVDRADLGVHDPSNLGLSYFDNYIDNGAGVYIVRDKAYKSGSGWSTAYQTAVGTTAHTSPTAPSYSGIGDGSWQQGWMEITTYSDAVLRMALSSQGSTGTGFRGTQLSTGVCDSTKYYDNRCGYAAIFPVYRSSYSPWRASVMEPPNTYCGHSPVENEDKDDWILPVNGNPDNPDYHFKATSQRPSTCTATAVPVTTWYEYVYGFYTNPLTTTYSNYRYFRYSFGLPGTPIGDEVNNVVSGFNGDFADGRWMIKASGIYPGATSNEYFSRTYPANFGNDSYDLGKYTSAGADKSDVSVPVSHGHYLCQSKFVGLRKGVSYLPKMIRKRNISSKEANFVDTAIVSNTIGLGTVLSDQFLCKYNTTTSKYDCAIKPAQTEIEAFEALVSNALSFPFTRYNSNDTILPDEHTYLDANQNPILVEYNKATDEGVLPRYATFTSSSTNLNADFSFAKPTDLTNSFRCAVQIEMDASGIVQKVDGRF